MKISIVTTVYNNIGTLKDTMDSILRQTYKDIEYIIVDGGSTDGTVELIRTYEPLFEGSMKWISERDRGMYDGMNKGIRMATGDVLGILNSDDYFTANDILEQVAKHLGDYDAVYGDVHFIHPATPDRCIRYYSSKHFRSWQMRFGYMPAHPSFYLRRELYEKYGSFSLDYKLAADFDMMVRLFCKHGIRARYIPRDFVTMRTGGQSNSSFSHRWTLTKEDAIACRRHGVYSNVIMCSVKYLTKLFEFRV